MNKPDMWTVGQGLASWFSVAKDATAIVLMLVAFCIFPNHQRAPQHANKPTGNFDWVEKSDFTGRGPQLTSWTGENSVFK